jgi:hypothetical protein
MKAMPLGFYEMAKSSWRERGSIYLQVGIKYLTLGMLTAINANI